MAPQHNPHLRAQASLGTKIVAPSSPVTLPRPHRHYSNDVLDLLIGPSSFLALAHFYSGCRPPVTAHFNFLGFSPLRISVSGPLAPFSVLVLVSETLALVSRSLSSLTYARLFIICPSPFWHSWLRQGCFR